MFFQLEKKAKEYKIKIEFIIVDSGGKVNWNWEMGRKYCKDVVGSDYFAINSLARQVDVMVLAYENMISSIAWIGLSDEVIEGTWKWVSLEPTNGFFNWQKNEVPVENTGRNYARLRLDEFGAGWQFAKGGLTYSALICSRR